MESKNFPAATNTPASSRAAPAGPREGATIGGAAVPPGRGDAGPARIREIRRAEQGHGWLKNGGAQARMKLSKTQSEAAKGAALLLMFWHHLFGFPERIPAAARLISVTGGGSFYLEHQLTLFGKLCVAVFLFLSGYGLGRKSEAFTPVQAALRTLGFYLVFWANFAVLMTIAWFFSARETGSWSRAGRALTGRRRVS